MRFVLALLLASPLLAQSPDTEFFEKRIRPLFAGKCYACHGAKMQMGGLNLTTGAGLHGANGALIPGDAAESRLYQALTYTGKMKMPPAGKLEEHEIAAVKEWIEAGAPWPGATASTQSGVTEEDRRHWAFQPIRRPEPPEVRGAAWIANPIDRFILARIEAKNLRPAPPADKLALLRRVTYDLIGLPPTVKEIEEFLADDSPQAFEKVIDRLLASPRYGERWGRHWLDVARYADSTGMDEDNLYPHGWRYRDYVIGAFNRDVPFDRFILEQIAGDLLPARDPEERVRNLTATGFLALGPRPLAQQDRLQMIYDVVDEQIDTVSKAFLGLTIACARCHDHKFDPILTKDYYSLASIFASTTVFRNHGRPGSISYFHYEPVDPDAFARYEAHRQRMYAKQLEMEDVLSEDHGRENAVLRPKVGACLTAAWKVIRQGDDAEASASAHDVDPKLLNKWVAFLRSADEKARSGYLKEWTEATADTIAEVAARYQETYMKSAEAWDRGIANWRMRMAYEVLQGRTLPARPKPDPEDHPFFAATTFDGGPMELPETPRAHLLRMEWKALEDSLPPEPELITAVTEGVPVQQRVFVRGNLHSPGEPVEKCFPVVLAGESQKPIEKGSGRLELARWLASPDNPLTARVLVNRLWQWHFGEALVRTPNNWGKTGEQPTHPELLDYLAGRLIDEGWSIKKMHRLILLSNTYRMSTRAPKPVREADPENRLWTRFQRVRMSVEQIRDSFLALDGSLDTAMGGTLLVDGLGKRQKVDLDEVKRRTVYVPVRRGNIPTLLSTFDFGDATTPSAGRTRTNVAPQALFVMNSRFVMERALEFARQLLEDESLSDAQRVERAYLSVLTRRPEPAEIDSALTYVAQLAQRLNQPEARTTAWQSFCHVLMSTNEFLYLE
ncbi:MAG: PSD1 and planctomycete cytochrome C domain-containing protein [Bryobacteraceae bacterium]